MAADAAPMIVPIFMALLFPLAQMPPLEVLSRGQDCIAPLRSAFAPLTVWLQ
jgi:hypothetical protein